MNNTVHLATGGQSFFPIHHYTNWTHIKLVEFTRNVLYKRVCTCAKFCRISVTRMWEKNRRRYFWSAPRINNFLELSSVLKKKIKLQPLCTLCSISDPDTLPSPWHPSPFIPHESIYNLFLMQKINREPNTIQNDILTLGHVILKATGDGTSTVGTLSKTLVGLAHDLHHIQATRTNPATSSVPYVGPLVRWLNDGFTYVLGGLHSGSETYLESPGKTLSEYAEKRIQELNKPGEAAAPAEGAQS